MESGRRMVSSIYQPPSKSVYACAVSVCWGVHIAYAFAALDKTVFFAADVCNLLGRIYCILMGLDLTFTGDGPAAAVYMLHTCLCGIVSDLQGAPVCLYMCNVLNTEHRICNL